MKQMWFFALWEFVRNLLEKYQDVTLTKKDTLRFILDESYKEVKVDSQIAGRIKALNKMMFEKQKTSWKFYL